MGERIAAAKAGAQTKAGALLLPSYLQSLSEPPLHGATLLLSRYQRELCRH